MCSPATILRHAVVLPLPLSPVITPMPRRSSKWPSRASSSRCRLLAAAPELASLLLLESALTVCTAALLAEHPTLGHDLRPDPEPPSLREARRLIAAAHRLLGTATRYRDAVVDSLVKPHRDSDPF